LKKGLEPFLAAECLFTNFTIERAVIVTPFCAPLFHFMPSAVFPTEPALQKFCLAHYLQRPEIRMGFRTEFENT
jgi:hypothetical protein